MNNETKGILARLYAFLKLVFKAVGTAIGVAVVAMCIMGVIELSSAVMLLGIGVAALGIAALMSKKDKE